MGGGWVSEGSTGPARTPWGREAAAPRPGLGKVGSPQCRSSTELLFTVTSTKGVKSHRKAVAEGDVPRQYLHQPPGEAVCPRLLRGPAVPSDLGGLGLPLLTHSLPAAPSPYHTHVHTETHTCSRTALLGALPRSLILTHVGRYFCKMLVGGHLT